MVSGAETVLDGRDSAELKSWLVAELLLRKRLETSSSVARVKGAGIRDPVVRVNLAASPCVMSAQAGLWHLGHEKHHWNPEFRQFRCNLVKLSSEV